MPKVMRIARHFAAVVVPFAADDSVDEAGLRSVCRHCLSMAGVDGLVVNAHAGEVDLLSTEERLLVLRIALEEASKQGAKVVAGVVPVPGSTSGAIMEARAMQSGGAHGLLLLGPSSFGRGVEFVPEAGEAYVRAVASAVTIPIIYFISGALSGINHTPELVRRLCGVDGVVGAKDTMWSPQGFDTNRKVYRGLDKDFDVLTGNDNCVFYNFVGGADGTLLILNTVLGGEIVRMFDLVQAGDIGAARAIHERYERLVEMLFARPMIKMPARHKHILQYWGVISSARTRAPLPGLSSEEGAALIAECDSLGLPRFNSRAAA